MRSSTPQHNHLVKKKVVSDVVEFTSILHYNPGSTVYLARLSKRHCSDQNHSAVRKNLPDPSYINPSETSIKKCYAVKCLNKKNRDSRQKKFLTREIVLHSLASKHPSVVSLHYVFDDESDSNILLLMDFFPDGDLFSMITEKKRYSVLRPKHNQMDIETINSYDSARKSMDITIKDSFCQILDAVEFCHSNGTFHRDLKPENILCAQGGTKLFLTDFGLATHEKTSSDYRHGSTSYMGPECLGGIGPILERYDTAANDIWSLGVILINMICASNPWVQASLYDDMFRNYLRDPEVLMRMLPISEETYSLLRRIFTIKESWRCSLNEVRIKLQAIPNLTVKVVAL